MSILLLSVNGKPKVNKASCAKCVFHVSQCIIPHITNHYQKEVLLCFKASLS